MGGGFVGETINMNHSAGCATTDKLKVKLRNKATILDSIYLKRSNGILSVKLLTTLR